MADDTAKPTPDLGAGPVRTVADVAARIGAVASYLRLATDPDPAQGWLRCADLLTDPDLVRESVASTTAGRGTDDLRVAGSLWQQSYAFRVPSMVLAAHALGLPLPTLDPAATWVRLTRHRPGQVAVSDHSLHGDPAPDELARRVVGDHLVPLAAAVREATGASRQVLDGNTASSLARVFAAVDRHGEARALLAAAAPWLPGAGTWDSAADRWVRATCCLWYRTADGGYCDDCVIPTGPARGRATT